MNKLRSKLGITALVGLLVMGNNVRAVANCGTCPEVCAGGYHTNNDNYLYSNNGGLRGTREYYIYNGFTSAQNTKIKSGIKAWNVANYIELSATTNVKSAQIIVQNSSLNSGMLGLTVFQKRSGEAYSTSWPNTNYTRALAYIDGSQNSSSQILVTSTHEIGHALGLTHVYCTNKSIMYPEYNGINVSKPSNMDIDAIEHIYC